MKLSLYIVFLISSITYSNAQNVWTGNTVPIGRILDMVVTANGTSIATTSSNGIWRSTNAGANWTKVNTNGEIYFNDLEIDASGNIYATTGSPSTARVFKSTDAGLTFSNLNSTGVTVYYAYLTAMPNGALLGSSGSTLQKSTNSGISFSDVNTTLGNVLDIEVDASNRIYAGINGAGVKVSTDGGTTFSPSPAPLATTVVDISISGTKIVALATDGPYISTNGGVTWTFIKNNISDATFSGVLKILPSGNLFLANTNFSKFYTSSNNGATWSSGANFSSNTVDFIATAFQSSTVFLAGGNSGISRSTDSGATWAKVDNKTYSYSDILVSSGNGIFIAANGINGFGKAFTSNLNVAIVTPPNANRPLSNFLESAVGHVYAYQSGSAGIIKSINSGTTWTVPNASQVLTNLVENNSKLLSVSGTNLLTSTDQGVTWPSTVISGFSGTATKVYASATADVIFVLNNTGILYKTVVSTSAATQVLTGVTDFTVGGNTLYALTTTTSLQKSTNDGGSFTSLTLPATYAANKIWAFDNQTIMTRSATNGIYAVNVSNNSGGFWTQKPLLDSGAGIAIVDLAFSSDGFAYGMVNNSTLHASAKSFVPPKAPANLKITVNSPSVPTFSIPLSGAFEFSMDDNSNNEEYFLLQGSKDNIVWDSVAFATSQPDARKRLYDFDYPNLKQGTQYYYRVQAVNAAGRSPFTNVVSATLTSYCASTIPNNRSWTGISTADAGSTPSGAGPFTNSNITILQNSGSADRYIINGFLFGIVPSAVHGNVGSVVVQENCGKVASFDTSFDFGNGPGTWDANTKTLTVKWQSQEFYTKFEGTTVFTLNSSDPVPATPTASAFIYSSNEAMVTWNTVDYATDYVIERSTTSGSGFAPVATVSYPTAIYLDKNLTPLTTYYYKIKAKHNHGPGSTLTESSYSAEVALQLNTPLYRPIETDLNFNFDVQQGASWADLDGDGDEDLVLATFTTAQGLQNQPPSVFENQGNLQMKRKEISALSGSDFNVTRGIGIMDVNNDGKLDMYIHLGNTGNDLVLINQGNWNFDKLFVNEVMGNVTRENLTMSDYDKDGFIDFYVGTEATPVIPNYLIKNNSGTSVSQILTGAIVTDLVNSRSASFVDYDNDGDQDLFALNNAAVSFLYKNNGDATFTRVTGLSFDSDVFTNRSISWGDIDNDGDLDLYLGGGNARMYRNDLTNFTRLTGSIFDNGGSGFSSSFGDIDNDGDLDLITTQPNRIYRNSGSPLFDFSIEPNAELINNPLLTSGGISLADVDKDGLLEIFPSKSAGSDVIPNLLFKPTFAVNASRNWLEVKLVGVVSNKAAIGARVTVVTTSPARSQIREVMGLTGYGSQNSLIQHFGLGTAVTCSLTIKWPSGIVQTLSGVTSNQLVTITEDNSGPVVVTLNPTKNSNAVPFATPLEITFDEHPTKVNGKKVTLYVASNLITPVQVFDASVGVVVGNKVSFTPGTALLPNTQYKVVVEDGAFKDIYGNTNVATALNWLFTSLDVSPPVFGSPAITFPATVSKGQATSLFLASVTDNVNVASVTMSYRGAGTSVATTDLAGVFNSTTTKWEFSIQESFYNTTGLEFYFTAKDADNNSTLYPASGKLQSVFETVVPVISVPSIPAVVVKGFGIRAFSVLSTDNVGVISVVMSYRNTKNGTVYTNLTGTLNTSIASQYDFSISESVFNGDGLEFYFTASDATGNTIRSPLSTAIPSTIKMLLDNQAPVVGPFIPTPSVVKANATFTVKASDNLGVSSIVMKYRGVSAKNFITSSPGVKNPAGDYEFAVLTDWFDNMGIEYYFRAVDASKNIGVSPDTTAASNKYHKTYLKFDAANPPKFSLIKGSTGASGYQIVSVPLELSNKNIADNFEELGTADKTAFRFLRYRSTPTVGWDEYPGGGLSILNRGEGYFLNSLKAEEITLLDGVAPPIDQNNFFQMALKKGWNQIGNPYTVQVQWSDVLSYNNNPAGVGKLVKYDNGYNTNDPNGIIEPFKGGFVQVDNDVTLKIPFKGFSSGRISIPTSDLSDQNWEVPFTLSQQGLTYQVGMIGMNQEASVGKDNFDLPVVPRLGEYIDASFDHPEHFMKKFAQDVVPTSDDYAWKFNVASNLTGEATISWNSESFGENNKELFLMDVNAQQLVDMRTQIFYSFDPKTSNEFKIYFGEGLEKKIKPSRVTLGRAIPNPTARTTTFAFSLPEKNAMVKVSLEVYDLMGKKVSTLVNGNFAPGFYSADWDTTLSNSIDGMYICRLTVNSDQGQEILSEKIIVKK
jgi:hypothetical protein